MSAFLLLSGSEAASAERGPILAHMFPEGSLPDEIAHKFVDALADEGGQSGAFTIVHGATLGDERQNVRQLLSGEIEFALTGDLFIGNLLPEFQALGLPFLHADFEAAERMHEGPVGKAVASAMSGYGLRIISRHCIGQRFLTGRDPVTKVGDLMGFKLRLPPDPVWTEFWRKLGASVVNVPFPKLKSALEAGQANGQENPPSFIRDLGLYDVQPYLMLTRHYVQYQFILMSEDRLAQLSPARVGQIEEAAKQASRWGCAKARADQAADLEWLRKEGGMRIVEFDASGAREIALDTIDRMSVPQSDVLLNHFRHE